MKKRSILAYSLRSIFRQKSRNAFIVLIIVLTTVFSLFTSSLFEGKNAQVKKTIIETETGHFQIIEKNFFEKGDPLTPRSLTPELRRGLEGFILTPELVLTTTILHPGGALELTLIGIEPDTHERLFPLKENVDGNWPPMAGDSRQIVVGKRFADKLGLKLGEELIITYQDKHKAILSEALVVSGIYHRYGPGFEGSVAYVDRMLLSGLLGISVNEPFHRLLLFPQKSSQIDLSDPDLVVRDWNELHPELSVMMKFHDGVTNALIIFMLVVAAVSIITPVAVLWDERRSEVNLLQTIGATDRVIYTLGATEAIVLSSLALFLALLIWGGLHILGTNLGLDFSTFGEKTVVRGGILISSVVYPRINLYHTGIILFSHGAIIFLCQFWAVRKVIGQESLR